MQTGVLTFDEWFEKFKRSVISQGYYGALDQRLFWEDYENEVSPFIAAKKFIKSLD